ncbi:MAG: hypothetical protein OCU20_03615 [Methanophagales archaeon]|nr:hypothetical protein [Methanophagales archaeon]MCW7069882.1 hypothetical protein [Methanophagales archaeon]MCW7072969.1 hypothetical protein [Methanophagales archaeon]
MAFLLTALFTISRGYTALAFSVQHSLKEVIITNDLIRTIHEDNMD